MVAGRLGDRQVEAIVLVGSQIVAGVGLIDDVVAATDLVELVLGASQRRQVRRPRLDIGTKLEAALDIGDARDRRELEHRTVGLTDHETAGAPPGHHQFVFLEARQGITQHRPGHFVALAQLRFGRQLLVDRILALDDRFQNLLVDRRSQ